MNFGGTFTRPLGTSASLEVWAKINVTTGTNTFTVAATDFRTPPNTTTQSYQVVTTATGTSALTYDLNGNCLSDGTRTYEWDAKNQLVAINYTGTNKRTEFTYNGAGCRVKILEKENGLLSNLKSLIWNNNQILEERDATNSTTKQFFSQGFVLPASGLQPPVSYFYTRDHLGSIREVSDSSGALHARYDYDPYGRVTKLSGDVSADFLYTGHYYHALSNLYLAKYRAYDPNTGRWLSRDPIAEGGGINLYGYVGNNPIDRIDPNGLLQWKTSVTEGNIREVENTNGLGRTGGDAIGYDAICTCKGFLQWELKDIIINYSFKYWLGDDSWYSSQSQKAWARRAEMDHVYARFNWAGGDGYDAALKVESSLKGKTWLTKSSCEYAAKSAVKAAVDPTFETMLEQQAALDSSGKHNWNNPDRRP